jgi:hypothetical protein
VIRVALAIAIAALATACSAAAPTAAVGPAAIEAAKRAVPPASPPPSPAGLSDLTGVWVIAQSGQPLKAGPVEACDRTRVLVLRQAGDSMTAFRAWFGYAGEIPLDGDSEITKGELTGNQIVRLRGTTAALDGTSNDVLYEFRFDVPSLHLKGTRNGEPFEAAQLLCPQLGRPEFQPRP